MKEAPGRAPFLFIRVRRKIRSNRYRGLILGFAVSEGAIGEFMPRASIEFIEIRYKRHTELYTVHRSVHPEDAAPIHGFQAIKKPPMTDGF